MIYWVLTIWYERQSNCYNPILDIDNITSTTTSCSQLTVYMECTSPHLDVVAQLNSNIQ